MRKSLNAVIALLLLSAAATAQEQQVKWRQILIGTYTVTWPASAGNVGDCLQYGTAGAMTWGSCGGGGGTSPWESAGGVISQVTATDHVRIGGGAAASEMRFMEPSGGGTSYMAFKSPALAASVTYTLPAADGSANQILKTNGSGTLSWVDASAASHPDPHRLGSGTKSAPAYSFSSPTTAGMYYAPTGQLGFSMGPGGYMQLAQDLSQPVLKLITNYATGNAVAVVSSLLNDETTMAKLQLAATQIMSSASGTRTLPAYSFMDHTTAGMYYAPTGQLGFSMGSGGYMQLAQYQNQPVLKLITNYATGNAFAVVTSLLNDETTMAGLVLQSSYVDAYPLTGSGEYRINGTKVVGARGTRVVSPAADLNQLKTAVDALILRLSDHGLIAP